MHVYTALERSTLDNLAEDLGMRLYDFADNGVGVRGRYAGRNRFKFVLRPLSADRDARYRLVRQNPYATSGSGEHRVWAICWHGHRDYMRAVFALDPDATFKTSVDVWDGSEDFEDRHEASGDRNIGSMMYPQCYADACHCAEVFA